MLTAGPVVSCLRCECDLVPRGGGPGPRHVGRGLCSRCYDEERRFERLESWPLLRKRKSVPSSTRPASGGFASLHLPEDPLPCVEHKGDFDGAEAMLEERGWLGHVQAVMAICRTCVGCPIREACESAAAREPAFSGIAGGRVWRQGEVIAC